MQELYAHETEKCIKRIHRCKICALPINSETESQQEHQQKACLTSLRKFAVEHKEPNENDFMPQPDQKAPYCAKCFQDHSIDDSRLLDTVFKAELKQDCEAGLMKRLTQLKSKLESQQRELQSLTAQAEVEKQKNQIMAHQLALDEVQHYFVNVPQPLSEIQPEFLTDLWSLIGKKEDNQGIPLMQKLSKTSEEFIPFSKTRSQNKTFKMKPY
ncbi:hypothetical protein FGO68_gene6534 [Halteria grandinella]|uniref:Uncharacterized protein n=1 Tax=Halteria grandinella TaxID=5974 RepID=A0A8J8NL19_HALGN|nr:hypothetical protein FGO68_gene6534 [Halteria grandinella]